MDIRAYAKINLCLNIDGVYNDRMHHVDMVLQEITLYDSLTVDRSESGITVTSDVILPPVNTASRAAEEFFSFTGVRGGAAIDIKKRIPSMAGLGGGSSDAAAVINALDDLYGTGLGTEDKVRIAIKVGSDVPFFINGGCARVSGRGDELAPVKNKLDPYIVLAKPESGVSTAEAYRLYDAMPNRGALVVDVIEFLEAGDMEGYAGAAGNSLYRPAMVLNRDVKKVASLFTDADFSMMTGSGSCVFAMYKDEDTAASALERAERDELVTFSRIVRKADRAVV